jgi:hypothetical protein
MFTDLLANLRRLQAETDFEIARCHDPYRLVHIISQFKLRLSLIEGEAQMMVQELEDER